jgi:hypothetical protein
MLEVEDPHLTHQACSSNDGTEVLLETLIERLTKLTVRRDRQFRCVLVESCILTLFPKEPADAARRRSSTGRSLVPDSFGLTALPVRRRNACRPAKHRKRQGLSLPISEVCSPQTLRRSPYSSPPSSAHRFVEIGLWLNARPLHSPRTTGGESGILACHFQYVIAREGDRHKTFQRLHLRPFHNSDFIHYSHSEHPFFSQNGMDGMDARFPSRELLHGARKRKRPAKAKSENQK